jgi:hypothetical protein
MTAQLDESNDAKSPERLCGAVHSDGNGKDLTTATRPDSASKEGLTEASCRFCRAPLRHTFVDLGMSPLCESYVPQDHLDAMEPFYPLHVLVCQQCLLVQLREYVSAEKIFSHYAYFSSYSDSWLEHARNYVEQMTKRFGLDHHSQVVEIASNDGYLLQYFAEKNIPVLGIEPAANVAEVARSKGIETLVLFFGEDTARELVRNGIRPNLLLGNNVLAQVPDLNGFVAGMKILLGSSGVITMEFPHLMRLIEENQFDTIYHEHFSYFSFHTVQQLFGAHGFVIFDVEELPTHGGSLRIYARHDEDTGRTVKPSVKALHDRELEAGYTHIDTYLDFGRKVAATKRELLDFLIQAKRAGKTVVGYGAPGKGNTLLNYCGIRTDFLDYTVDRSPYKQGMFLPGTHIPIYAPERIEKTKPDYVLILPWNLKDEIIDQLSHIRHWGARFVVPIPEVRVYD